MSPKSLRRNIEAVPKFANSREQDYFRAYNAYPPTIDDSESIEDLRERIEVLQSQADDGHSGEGDIEQLRHEIDFLQEGIERRLPRQITGEI